MSAANARAVPNFIAALLPAPQPYAVWTAILAAVAYAFGALVVIFYLFEKTQSVEVHFFIFFVFSFAVEVARSWLPACLEMGLPSLYISIASRALVFFRCMGMFSLFCAGLYAAGFKIEKEENVLLPLVIITLFIALDIPINIFTCNTSLCVVDGFPAVFRAMNVIVVVLTVLSFVYGAWQRGARVYYYVAAGSLCAFVGRAMLFAADTYVFAVVGFGLLVIGTYFICRHLREYYLWA
jgi:hypothetical protein